jgi:hypothetical protein
MSDALERNESGIDAIKLEAASLLILLAEILVMEEKAEWKPSPFPSKPGEHLRKVTGNAQDQLVHYPTEALDVVRDGEVRVFYQLNAWYAPYWERNGAGKRRGLEEKFAELQATGWAGARIKGSY